MTLLHLLQSYWPAFTRSIWPHLLVPAVHVLTLTFPPFPFRKAISTTLTALLAYPCFACELGPWASETSVRYLSASLWMYHLASVAKIVLFNPERDFWRTDDDDEDGDGDKSEERTGSPGGSSEKSRTKKGKKLEKHCRREHDAERMSFGLAKFKWALGLIFSYRGVGWNWQVKGVPAAPIVNGREEDNTHFRLRMIKSIVVCYALLDVATTFIISQHFTVPEQSVLGLSLGRRTLMLVTLLPHTFASGYMGYCMVALVRSLIEGRKPKYWRPPFGDISQVTSLRDFWGYFWHQFMRNMFQSWGRAFVNLFHVKRDTWLSSIVQTVFIFALSGLGHAVASWRMGPTPPFFGMEERFWSMFWFFVVQAIGVIVEGVVRTVIDELELAFEWDDQKGRTHGWRDWIGRIWVIGWMWCSGHLALNCYLKTGQGLLSVPFSFVRFAMQQLRYSYS